MKRKSYISLSLLLALAAAQTPAAATRADHLNTVTSGILRYSDSGHDASGHANATRSRTSAQRSDSAAPAQADAPDQVHAPAQADASGRTSAASQTGTSAWPASTSVSSASVILRLVNPLSDGFKGSEGYAGTDVPALPGLNRTEETEAGPAMPAKDRQSTSGKGSAETDDTPAAEASTETEVPSTPVPQDSGVIGEDAETESDDAQAANGFFQSPDIEGCNDARISLYD